MRCGGDDCRDEGLCDVVTVSGTEYTEIFDRSALEALNSATKARSSEEP